MLALYCTGHPHLFLLFETLCIDVTSPWQRRHVGGQDLSCCAHVLCWQSTLALSLSVSARARASPAVWHAGVGPLAACMAMAHVAVPRLTPNTRGRPSVTSYAYGILPIQLLLCISWPTSSQRWSRIKMLAINWTLMTYVMTAERMQCVCYIIMYIFMINNSCNIMCGIQTSC